MRWWLFSGGKIPLGFGDKDERAPLPNADVPEWLVFLLGAAAVLYAIYGIYFLLTFCGGC